MPITINGTTVTTNRINGTPISKETVNGTQVYGSKVWAYIFETTSEIVTHLGFVESSSAQSYWLLELTAQYPPNNYAVGTTAGVWDGNTTFWVYQVQEE